MVHDMIRIIYYIKAQAQAQHKTNTPLIYFVPYVFAYFFLYLTTYIFTGGARLS
jgi:hypothetical protein